MYLKTTLYFKNQYLMYGLFLLLVAPLNAIVWITDTISAEFSKAFPTQTSRILSYNLNSRKFKKYGLFYTRALDIQAYRELYNERGLKGILFSMPLTLWYFLMTVFIESLAIPRAILNLTINLSVKDGLENILHFIVVFPMRAELGATMLLSNFTQSIVSEIRCMSFSRGNTPEQNYVRLLHKRLKADMLGDIRENRRDRLAIGISDAAASQIVQILRLPAQYNTGYMVQRIEEPVAHVVASAIETFPLAFKSIGFPVIMPAVESVRIIAASLPKCTATLEKLYIDCLRVQDPTMDTFDGQTDPSELESLRIIVNFLPFDNALKMLSVEMRIITYEIALVISELINKCTALNEFSLMWNSIDVAGMRIISDALMAKATISKLSFAAFRKTNPNPEAIQIMLDTCKQIKNLQKIECLGGGLSQALNADLCNFINNSETIKTAAILFSIAAEEQIYKILSTNTKLKTLYLYRTNLKKEYQQKLANALKSNPDTPLNLIACNWEGTALQDAVDSINTQRMNLNISWAYFRSRRESSLNQDAVIHLEKFIAPKRNMGFVYKTTPHIFG